MRPRRPVMRLAAGAATAGIAYRQGKKHAQQQEQPVQQYAPAPAAAPTAPVDATGELERLAKLHDSGALTDAEFGAAKSQLLGV